MNDQQPEPHPHMSMDVDWAAMDKWLVESMGNMPRAAILDIGPAGARGDDSEDVDCAQIQVLGSETFLVRLSTTMMSTPLLSSYGVPRAALDMWFYDDTFDDCTHGYLMSRSRRRIAEIVVAWFRDRCGFSAPDDLGCSYTEPVALPRSATTYEGSASQRQGYP
ncbi:hypothetical protein [Gordonia insulae]|uniref:Uncharacterized protein n=1 Tax=Gordonia insulae TaxID=2420509 RepID=A0A3G8JVB5_9ACTN|nr:hypothetical protein [Gordonia insulae]AZG48529.1 hypothetical protein D7316_05146 [Gordonia insulae]